jgi:Zn-dependent peptidase ImmA (M78 family)
VDYQAEPLKRIQLRAVAKQIRNLVGLENTINFPVMVFLEHIMPLLYKDFYYEILPKSTFPPKKHADTDIVHHVIRIREDVYLRAINGLGRDRMTIAHEIAHYILLVVCGVKFARTFGFPMARYEDPEWQAKALAGELLCPYHLIGNMKPNQIIRKCGVSEAAALFAYNLHHGFSQERCS